MTIGEEMTAIIAKKLAPKGTIVPPIDLWNAVGDGEQMHSLRFNRYRSVLSELLRTRQIAPHKEGDTLKGFVWIGKAYKH